MKEEELKQELNNEASLYCQEYATFETYDSVHKAYIFSAGSREKRIGELEQKYSKQADDFENMKAGLESEIAELKEENARLKAHLPQWHDLRKDPNDLPKNEKTVQVLFWEYDAINEYNCVYDIQAKQWLYYNTDEMSFCLFDYTVIAWCEIPEF